MIQADMEKAKVKFLLLEIIQVIQIDMEQANMNQADMEKADLEQTDMQADMDSFQEQGLACM